MDSLMKVQCCNIPFVVRGEPFEVLERLMLEELEASRTPAMVITGGKLLTAAAAGIAAGWTFGNALGVTGEFTLIGGEMSLLFMAPTEIFAAVCVLGWKKKKH